MNAIINDAGKFVAILTGEHDLAMGYSLIEVSESDASKLNDACRYDGGRWIYPTPIQPVAGEGQTIVTI